MNDITYTATVLDRHRADDLARDVERLRRQAERRAARDVWNRPTGFAVVTDWVAGRLPRLYIPRIAAPH